MYINNENGNKFLITKPVTQGQYEQDWAYVIFDQNIGATTQWFEIGVYSDYELAYMEVVTAGYISSYSMALRRSSGNIIGMTQNGLLYDASSLDGASGCPVFRWYNGQYYVVGINSGNPSPVQDGRIINWGKRFTNNMVNHLQSLGYISAS